jgi:hypothetical protein
VGVDEVTQFEQVSRGELLMALAALRGAHSITATTSPALTESPVATLMLLTTPAFSAFTEFSIFMASRIIDGVAGLDRLAHLDAHLDDGALHGHVTVPNRCPGPRRGAGGVAWRPY